MALRRRGVLAVLATALLALPAAAGAAPTMKPIAGGGLNPLDDIPALETSIATPAGIAAIGPNLPLNGAAAEWVFIDDTGCRIRRVVGPVVLLAAGNLTCGGGLPFSSATPSNVPLRHPDGVARAADGSFYIADTDNGMIHRWIDGLVITVAGNGTTAGSGAENCDYAGPYPGEQEAGDLTATDDPRDEDFCHVFDVSGHPTDGNEFLFMEFRTFATGGNVVYHVDDNVVRRAAGGGCGKSPTGTSPEQCITGWSDVAWDHAGAGFVVSNQAESKLHYFAAPDFSPSSHSILATGLGGPWDVAAHRDGTYLVAENAKCRISRVTADGAVSTFAGIPRIGNAPCPGDTQAGPADATGINFPLAVEEFPDGVLIGSSDGVIRHIDRTSILTGPDKVTSNPEATFTFDGTDLDAQWYCRLDPDPNVFVITPPCGEGTDKSETITLAGDGSDDGEHLMQISAAGETDKEEWTWTLDTQPPPQFGLLEPADGATALTPRPVFKWERSKDATTDTLPPKVFIGNELAASDDAACDVTTCSGSPSSDLPEGTHTWRVELTDAAGNTRTSATRTFSVGTPPTAGLTAAPNPVLAGGTVTFSSTSADANGPIARHEWDLDGDGEYELDTAAVPSTSRSYPTAGQVQIGLRVTDGIGLTATATTTLQVNNPPVPAGQLGVTVNNGAQYTNDRQVKVLLRFPATATQVLLSNDGGFLAPRTFAPAPEVEWTLDSSGPERLPKTVYVRFLLGGLVSETFTDDIILDETPPTVSSASLAGAAAARVAAVKRWTLKLRASDSNSGVAGVQVTASKRKPGKLLGYKRTLRVKSSSRPRFVRAKDVAGNYSAWKKLK